jgi:hypothetical protein
MGMTGTPGKLINRKAARMMAPTSTQGNICPRPADPLFAQSLGHADRPRHPVDLLENAIIEASLLPMARQVVDATLVAPPFLCKVKAEAAAINARARAPRKSGPKARQDAPEGRKSALAP